MTEEKRTFSYSSETGETSSASSISELTPQPVMDFALDDVSATAAPAHFAEPARPAVPDSAPGATEDAFELDDDIPEAQHFASPEDPGTLPADPAADPLFADLTARDDAAGANELNPSPVALATDVDAFPDELSASPLSHPDEEPDDQVTGPLPTPEEVEAAQSAHVVPPGDTAEIDVDHIEAKLQDPGTTQSFAPITDDRIATDSTYDAGTTTSLMWGARSDVGCVRPHNEDSYLVASPLFAVCDGMGGHAAGEVASSIAVETIAKAAPATADAAGLAAAVEAANTAIIEAAAAGIGRPGMGCTATVAYIQDNTVAIAHVGDSRAYLLHEGVLTRVTHDHSYVEELVDAGEITADEARIHPNRSVITRALGSDPAMYADHFQLNIDEGDRLILCSDGLSSMIPDSEIERIAVQSSTAQMCTDNLVDAALAAGGADNVSVVVVDLVVDGRVQQVVRVHRRNLIITIAAAVAAIVLAAAFVAFSIGNSIYLGVYGDTVAVYRGVPASLLGIELNSLVEETSIKLSDLPEDTRNRLAEGISQTGLDEAWDTLSDYRKQINDAQEAQRANAEAIRESSADQAETQKDASQTDGAQTQESQTQEGGA